MRYCLIEEFISCATLLTFFLLLTATFITIIYLINYFIYLFIIIVFNWIILISWILYIAQKVLNKYLRKTLLITYKKQKYSALFEELNLHDRKTREVIANNMKYHYHSHSRIRVESETKYIHTILYTIWSLEEGFW